MRRVVRCCCLTGIVVGSAGCLEEVRPGGLAAGGVEAVAQPGAAVACESAQVPEYAVVAPAVSGMAVGPCGHVVWAEPVPGDGQRVVLVGPDLSPLGEFHEQNGWFGALNFSADGTLAAYDTYRSDLGDGDTTLVDLESPEAPLLAIDFEGPGPWGFFRGPDGPGLWECDRGWDVSRVVAKDGAGLRELAQGVGCGEVVWRGSLVVAPAQEALAWWDLDAGTSGSLAAFAPPDLFRVSADGELVAVQASADAAPVRIYRRATGALLAELEGSLSGAAVAKRGSSLLIPGAGGFASIDAEGAPAVHPAAVPLFAFSDASRALAQITELATTSFSVLDLASGAETRVPGHAGAFLPSASERAVAFVHTLQSQAGYTVSVWREGAGEVTALLYTMDSDRPELAWVGEDGTVLITRSLDGAGGSTRPGLPGPTASLELWGPDGAMRWSLQDHAPKGIGAAGALLYVTTSQAGIERLFVLDPARGVHRMVAESEHLVAATDAAGQRLAVHSVRWDPAPSPDPLSFGRLPAP